MSKRIFILILLTIQIFSCRIQNRQKGFDGPFFNTKSLSLNVIPASKIIDNSPDKNHDTVLVGMSNFKTSPQKITTNAELKENKNRIESKVQVDTNTISSNPKKRSTNSGFGIAALSVSFVGMFFAGIILGILGIIFGAIGMQPQRKLKGLAIAGFVLGILDVFFTVLFLLVLI